MDHEKLAPIETESNQDLEDEELTLRKRHGARNQHKIKFFLRWLSQTFPIAMARTVEDESDSSSPTNLTATADNDPFFSLPHILDIAGGKGELAARLCFCNRQRVVLVDPRPADIVTCYENTVFRGLPKKWQTGLREKQKSNPTLLHETLQARFRQLTMYFDTQTVANDKSLGEAVQNAQLLVGMHADGATEAIVDIALHYHKPFVVVPCCVFPSFFPHRQLRGHNGVSRKVQSYQDFCEYLVQKDPRFQRSVLPFEGRNIAIWWDGK